MFSIYLPMFQSVHSVNSYGNLTAYIRVMYDLFKNECVLDAVEDPVLTVNSNWFSGNFCTVNFTCRGHDLMINSSYQNNRCSPEEVTSHENYTLILHCSEELIICNHSNPVSWKKDRINITPLCVKGIWSNTQRDTRTDTHPHTHTHTALSNQSC